MNTNADQISISEGFSPSSLTGPPAEPRLGIRHLMLWTALSAVLMVASQLRQWSALAPVWSSFMAISLVASAAALTVVLVRLAWWRSLGVRWLCEPGHALALLASISFLLSMPMQFFYVWFLRRTTDGSFSFLDEMPSWLIFFMQYSSTGGVLLCGGLALGFAWKSRNWWWRIAFLSIPVFDAVSMVVSSFLVRMFAPVGLQLSLQQGWFSLLQMWPQVLTLLLIVAASVKQKSLCHWTHWWGVLAYALPIVFSLLSIFVVIALGGWQNIL